MRHHFDFTLQDEDSDGESIIFRFYQRQTNIHSFESGEKHNALTPSWDKVYKVYYCWGILKRTDYSKDDFEDRNDIQSEPVFYMSCDECSNIPYLSKFIREVKRTGEAIEESGFGWPSSDWRIDKFGKRYRFMVFDNFYHTGYKFCLDEKKTDEFCKWLDMINEYALQHWEEI